MSENPAPPAGWYADPQNPAQTRYWDGVTWTPHVAFSAGAPSAAPAGPHTAPGAYAVQPKKKGLSTGAIVAIVVGSVMVLIFVAMAAISIPIFTTQRAKATDAAAKADVTTLGLEIATYAVNHDGPAPQIVVVNGAYVFEDGTPMTRKRPVSSRVQFGGQTSTSSLDWCVWVTAPRGDLKDFEYSPESGLRQGRCGQ